MSDNIPNPLPDDSREVEKEQIKTLLSFVNGLFKDEEHFEEIFELILKLGVNISSGLNLEPNNDVLLDDTDIDDNMSTSDGEVHNYTLSDPLHEIINAEAILLEYIRGVVDENIVIESQLIMDKYYQVDKLSKLTVCIFWTYLFKSVFTKNSNPIHNKMILKLGILQDVSSSSWRELTKQLVKILMGISKLLDLIERENAAIDVEFELQRIDLFKKLTESNLVGKDNQQLYQKVYDYIFENYLFELNGKAVKITKGVKSKISPADLRRIKNEVQLLAIKLLGENSTVQIDRLNAETTLLSRIHVKITTILEFLLASE